MQKELTAMKRHRVILSALSFLSQTPLDVIFAKWLIFMPIKARGLFVSWNLANKLKELELDRTLVGKEEEEIKKAASY